MIALKRAGTAVTPFRLGKGLRDPNCRGLDKFGSNKRFSFVEIADGGPTASGRGFIRRELVL